MRTYRVAVYKNDSQLDNLLSICCLHEFLLRLAPLSSCLSFSSLISDIIFPSSPGSSAPLSVIILFSSSHQTTLSQSPSAVKDVGFDHGSLLSVSSFLAPCLPPLFQISSSLSLVVLTKRGDCLRSCNGSVCLNWKWLPPSLLFPLHTLSHLSSSPTPPILPMCFFYLFFCLFNVATSSPRLCRLSYFISFKLRNLFFLYFFAVSD